MSLGVTHVLIAAVLLNMTMCLGYIFNEETVLTRIRAILPPVETEHILPTGVPQLNIVPLRSAISNWDSVSLYHEPVRCNIKRLPPLHAMLSLTEDCRVETLSMEQFINEFDEKEPVVVTNYNPDGIEKFRRLTSKQYLLQQCDQAFSYGNIPLTLSTANSYSYDKSVVTLTEYIDHMMGTQDLETTADKTYYHFGNNNPLFEPLFEDYPIPPWTTRNKTSLSWGLAGDGTGVPFHIHGAVWAEVMHGKKWWFLTKPDNAPKWNPNLTTLHWLLNSYPNLSEREKPMQCIVSPGEILYIPSNWFHATLNLGQSVFMSAFV